MLAKHDAEQLAYPTRFISIQLEKGQLCHIIKTPVEELIVSLIKFISKVHTITVKFTGHFCSIDIRV